MLNPNFEPNFSNQTSSGILNVTQIFDSDEFYMYIFKVKKCPKMKSHDWTACPFLHKGEKARRRDPRKFHYSAEICPQYRLGQCKRGDLCDCAHGIFEYWLHPAKFRTRMCNAGMFCQRKVCFFAHSEEQLRQGMKHKCQCTCRLRLDHHHHNHHTSSTSTGASTTTSTAGGSAGAGVMVPEMEMETAVAGGESEEVRMVMSWELLEELKRLSLEDDDDQYLLPDIDWVSELVN